MPAKKPAKAASPSPKPPPKPPRQPREPMSAAAKARARWLVLNALAAGAFIGVCGVGYVASVRYVATLQKPQAAPAVVLADRPAWLNDAWAAQVLAAADPRPAAPTDRAALSNEAASVAACPWVKSVTSVRRVYQNGPGDTLVIDCVFRTPVALVRWQDTYWYVDAEGVRLPERLTAAAVRQMAAGGKPMFRVIDGVAHAPDAPGRPWPGRDVQAGLELVTLLADKSYADQITRIDVGNYDGRVNANESQINLVTRYNTEVRWGQPPSSRAFFVEQRVDRKLDVLEQACRQTGRVDMNLPWIDLRFDSPTTGSGRASLDMAR